MIGQIKYLEPIIDCLWLPRYDNPFTQYAEVINLPRLIAPTNWKGIKPDSYYNIALLCITKKPPMFKGPQLKQWDTYLKGFCTPFHQAKDDFRTFNSLLK